MVEEAKRLYETVRNKTLNAIGVERDLQQLLNDSDISRVKQLLQNRDIYVENALKEYHPETHSVMSRYDKPREGKRAYQTEKLPRTRQRYINEMELFFLLGKPVLWKNNTPEKEEVYNVFMQLVKGTRLDSVLRKVKRIAGSETEAAILFHLYQENGISQVKPVVLAYSEGYKLRPLFDQYDNMLAFGYGYNLRENGKTVEHFDVQTPDYIYQSKKTLTGWSVEKMPNPTKKINVVYVCQKTAWDGVQPRIDREERIDSVIADTNNYFADPMAIATADVLDNLPGPSKPGKIIQLNGEKSKFEYINPPIASELQANEKKELQTSILFDSFTPDMSFDSLKGMGTLSGSALRRAMSLGYIKRDILKETYDVAVSRCKNILLAIMARVTNIELMGQIADIDIEFEFAEPFSEDTQEKWAAIGKAYNDGIMSLDEAISQLGVADNPQEELEKINQQSALSNTSRLFEPTI